MNSRACAWVSGGVRNAPCHARLQGDDSLTDDAPAIWTAVLVRMNESHPGLSRPWFAELEPVDLDAGVLSVRVADEVQRDYLTRHCTEQFRSIAQEVTGRFMAVRFLGPNDPLSDESGVATSTAQASHAAGGLVLNPDYTFEHFVVGPGNRLAHAAARAVCENPGRAYNPFFVHGDVGLGKTHLLQAVCLEIKRQHPGTRLMYLSCEGFMTRFIDDVKAGRMTEFRNAFRGVDVLAIDDVQFLAKRDRTQEEFFHTFNALHQDNRQIILSSDAPPEDIPDLEDRLVSRFKWGLVASVDAPGFETRVEIVKEKGRLRGMVVPDDVACFIAERVPTNIRELEGALTKIQLQSAIDRQPATIEVARAALGGPSTPTRPTMDAIIRSVTEAHNVRVSELQSKKRSRSVSIPRQLCMYLARKHTDHSLVEIGGFFGGRDHTTVMHAIKTIESKLDVENDEQIRESVDAIERALRADAHRKIDA